MYAGGPMNEELARLLQSTPVIPVIVLERAEDAIPLARALVEGGIRVLEITLRTGVALDGIRQIAGNVEDAVVGAGTVLDGRQLEQAIEAGARFAVSPGLTPALLQTARRSPVPFLPGVASASEVMLGLESGFRHFKFFPAGTAGGVAALKALQGPFPEVTFCPTGGINEENYLDYLQLDNVLCVGGSWVVPAEAIRAGDWDGIKKLVREAVSAINEE